MGLPQLAWNNNGWDVVRGGGETDLVGERQPAKLPDVFSCGAVTIIKFEEPPRRIWGNSLTSTQPLRARVIFACVMEKMQFHASI
jgi:hypothetical protein